MKRVVYIFLVLLLVLPWMTSGCGKGKEGAAPKEGMKHETSKPEAKKTVEMDEMKGLTMESIQKEGKMEVVAPGTVQISPQKQQLIGVKFGTVEMKPLEKTIRTRRKG
jgi:hypothetical protein